MNLKIENAISVTSTICSRVDDINESLQMAKKLNSNFHIYDNLGRLKRKMRTKTKSFHSFKKIKNMKSKISQKKKRPKNELNELEPKRSYIHNWLSKRFFFQNYRNTLIPSLSRNRSLSCSKKNFKNKCVVYEDNLINYVRIIYKNKKIMYDFFSRMMVIYTLKKLFLLNFNSIVFIFFQDPSQNFFSRKVNKIFLYEIELYDFDSFPNSYLGQIEIIQFNNTFNSPCHDHEVEINPLP